jgi:hypothetical protein
MITCTEIELYQRICELEGISFIECNKDVLDLLKICYLNVTDLREINRNNVKKVDSNFNLAIENFKNVNHSLKTLESKCDKTLSMFRREIQKIDDLNNDLNKRIDLLEQEADDRIRRICNVTTLFYWISVINFFLVIFF